MPFRRHNLAYCRFGPRAPRYLPAEEGRTTHWHQVGVRTSGKVWVPCSDETPADAVGPRQREARSRSTAARLARQERLPRELTAASPRVAERPGSFCLAAIARYAVNLVVPPLAQTDEPLSWLGRNTRLVRHGGDVDLDHGSVPALRGIMVSPKYET